MSVKTSPILQEKKHLLHRVLYAMIMRAIKEAKQQQQGNSNNNTAYTSFIHNASILYPKKPKNPV